MIPTENRATLMAILDGLTQEEYLNEIWRRRNKAYDRTVSFGKWPMKRSSHLSIVKNRD